MSGLALPGLANDGGRHRPFGETGAGFQARPGRTAVGIWSIPEERDGGWNGLSFHLALHQYPVEKQWFAGYQWDFLDPEARTAYIGIQPAPGGKADLRFSVLGDGTRPMDTDRCGPGADGGPGVTCDQASITLERGYEYALTVTRWGTRGWRGYIRGRGGRVTEIGKWEIPGTGGLPSSGLVWLEHFDYCTCERMPRFSVTAGPVYGYYDSVTGRCHDAAPAGRCSAAQTNFTAQEHSDGRLSMASGWEGSSCQSSRHAHDDNRDRGYCDGNVSVDVDVVVNGRRERGR